MTEYDGMELVYGCDELSVQFYKLELTLRAIGEFIPNRIRVRELRSGVAATRVWPGNRRCAPRHPPRPQQFALEDLQVDATEDAEGPEELSDDECMVEDGGEHEEFQMEMELEELMEEAGVIAELGLGVDPDVDMPGDADLVPANSSDAVLEPQAPQPEDASVPPPPPPLMAGGRLGRQKAATATWQVLGGRISFYSKKNAFEGVCQNPEHGKCVATRTNKSKGLCEDGLPKGGRPVGFLAAWLSHSETTQTKEEHWAAFDNSHEQRLDLRREIARTQGGAHLLTFERPLVDGESEEPRTLEGYAS